MIIFPLILGGCGSGHPYSDFSLQFGLGQEASIQIPPGKSVTVTLAIGFIERNPGDIHVSWGGLPAGVSATPTSVTFTATGQQSVQFAAAPNAPDTSNPLPLTITGVAGSITHSITLYITVGPDDAAASNKGCRLLWNRPGNLPKQTRGGIQIRFQTPSLFHSQSPCHLPV
jgi:hypothetical protein